MRYLVTALGIGTAMIGCMATPPKAAPNPRDMAPGLHTDIKTRLYEVDASSVSHFREMLQRMNEDAGYRAPVGQVAVGLTSGRLGYAFDAVPGPGGCAIANTRVTVQQTIRLPHWTTPGDTPREIKQAWDQYVSQITAHEHGHVDITVNAAKEIAKQLDAISAPTCNEAESRARRDADAIVSSERSKQGELDARDEGHIVWQYATKP